MNKSLAPVACVAFFACAVAHADVTIQDQTTMNFAIIKAHGTSTNRITDDKKRTESEFSCDGFMSMLCGKNDTLEIVRLDQSVTMNGDAKKKSYTEVPFPTPEQRQAMAAAHAGRDRKDEILPDSPDSRGHQFPECGHIKVPNDAADNECRQHRRHGKLCWPRGAPLDPDHDPELREQGHRRLVRYGLHVRSLAGQ